ncbi:MAG: glycosyl hydrolase family 18 protein [Clostridia bacterium]
MKRLIIILLMVAALISITIAYYLLPNYTIISPFVSNQWQLLVEGELVTDKEAPVLENGEILISLPVVKSYFDSKVYWDSKSQKVIFTTSDKVIKMKTDNLTAMINSRPVDLNIPARLIKDVPYVPIQFLSDLFGVEVKWIETNKVVIVDYKGSSKQIAEVIEEDAKIRKNPTIKAPVLVNELKIGQTMRAFEEYGDKWCKVRTDDGILGYIEKRFVKVYQEPDKLVGKQPEYSTIWNPEQGKINLVWEHIQQKTPDMSKTSKIKGLDVISPTWFDIVDKQGTIANKADAKYIEWAHENGYKIWGLVTNNFDPELTSIILNNSEVREKIIQQLLVYAKLYKLDGINIDFENIYLRDKDMLTQFVRELVPLLKEQGLVVSMDVTVKSTSENWSMCYDRKALAQVLDYVAVMTYDQHWATSPTAGSVAQLSWVEQGIKKLFDEIPPQKMLLGLPFYTREWKEEVVDGKKETSSRAISMDAAQQIIKDKKVDVVWDEKSGQYYAEYKDGQVVYKIWVEDAKSINLKTSLVHKYNLAGAASWRRGFESEDIWAVLNENLKEKQDYTQWAKVNGYEDKVFE